jgi:hypothetical protein
MRYPSEVRTRYLAGRMTWIGVCLSSSTAWADAGAHPGLVLQLMLIASVLCDSQC